MRPLPAAGLILLAVLAPGRAAAAQDADTLPLDRRGEVSLVRTPLPSALVTLRHDRKLPLAFSGDLIPPGRLVTLSMRGSLREILTALLRDTGLTFAMTARGTVVIVPERRGSGGGGSIREWSGICRLLT